MIKRSVFVLLVAATQSLACAAPEGWVAVANGNDDAPKLYAPSDPAQTHSPFDLIIEFCTQKGELVGVDAMMPAHQHGMNYTPTMTRNSLDLFDISGMVFHMPGMWRVTVSAQFDGELKRFDYDLSAK